MPQTKESLYKTHYQCSYLFRFTGIAITWRTNRIEIFEVVIGRTYDNNYYNHSELVLSNLVQNDSVIWNRLQIVISHSQGKNIHKIHKWHMTINKITVSEFVNTLNHDAKCVESLIKFYSWLLCLGDLRRSSFHQCMLKCFDQQLVWLSWCDIMAMWLKPVSQLQ